MSVKGIHQEGNIFFKQMSVACSIFSLYVGWVQLFWAAFDMPVTVVSLKVALGLEKFDFWAFQKIIMRSHLTFTCVIIFKCPKIKFFPIQ